MKNPKPTIIFYQKFKEIIELNFISKPNFFFEIKLFSTKYLIILLVVLPLFSCLHENSNQNLQSLKLSQNLQTESSEKKSKLAKQKPQIQLANIFHKDIDLKNYLVSEKLDGVRAYWDGEKLISREGNVFAAPKWFTANFPKEHLEGELWIERDKFEELSAIVRKENPDESSWRKVRLMLFDMPKDREIFSQRFEKMQKIVAESKSKYLEIIPQTKISDYQTLMKRLDEVVKNKGEGLMLHRTDSFYQATRNDDILKLKTFEDAEAIVIAHIKGKGKFSKVLGAILVENEEKVRFKIGGGFSYEQRKSPPKIGSKITYKFFGKTKNNKPRFARFLRVREDF